MARGCKVHSGRVLCGGSERSADADFAPDFAAQLRRDAMRFEQEGLDGLDEAERQRLVGVYRGFEDPTAGEIVDWLEGGYAFDPDCLTG